MATGATGQTRLPILAGPGMHDVTEVRSRGAQAAKGPRFVAAFSILEQTDVEKAAS